MMMNPAVNDNNNNPPPPSSPMMATTMTMSTRMLSAVPLCRQRLSFRTESVFVMQSVQQDQVMFPHSRIHRVPYTHGGGFGAAPFFLANPHWIAVLRYLMPDVYIEISRRVYHAPPHKLIHWAENNPVVAAYGTAHELEFALQQQQQKQQQHQQQQQQIPSMDSDSSNTSQPHYGISNIEWDVFLDPYLVRRVQVVLQERQVYLLSVLPELPTVQPMETLPRSILATLEPAQARVVQYYEHELRRRVSALVDQMLIAHGNLAQLSAEQVNLGGGSDGFFLQRWLQQYNYSRVQRTRRTLGGGIFARHWMAVYAESLRVGLCDEGCNELRGGMMMMMRNGSSTTTTMPYASNDDDDCRDGGGSRSLWQEDDEDDDDDYYSDNDESDILATIEDDSEQENDELLNPSQIVDRTAAAAAAAAEDDNQYGVENSIRVISSGAHKQQGPTEHGIRPRVRRRGKRKESSFCPNTSIAASVAIIKHIASRYFYNGNSSSNNRVAAAGTGPADKSTRPFAHSNSAHDPFGLVLDVKSRHVPMPVWACVVDMLRESGVRVEAVGSFIAEEIRNLSRHTVWPVPELLFFHSAGDLQQACHSKRIRYGDTVFFNGGSLLWSPLRHRYRLMHLNHGSASKILWCTCSCHGLCSSFDEKSTKQSYRIQPFGLPSDYYNKSVGDDHGQAGENHRNNNIYSSDDAILMMNGCWQRKSFKSSALSASTRPKKPNVTGDATKSNDKCDVFRQQQQQSSQLDGNGQSAYHKFEEDMKNGRVKLMRATDDVNKNDDDDDDDDTDLSSKQSCKRCACGTGCIGGSTIQDYKKRYNLSIGLYVQEFAIDDCAADALVQLVNDIAPDIYNLGLSWGGVNGITLRGICPGRFTETTGYWNQQYLGAYWDPSLRPPV